MKYNNPILAEIRRLWGNKGNQTSGRDVVGASAPGNECSWGISPWEWMQLAQQSKMIKN